MNSDIKFFSLDVILAMIKNINQVFGFNMNYFVFGMVHNLTMVAVSKDHDCNKFNIFQRDFSNINKQQNMICEEILIAMDSSKNKSKCYITCIVCNGKPFDLIELRTRIFFNIFQIIIILSLYLLILKDIGCAIIFPEISRCATIAKKWMIISVFGTILAIMDEIRQMTDHFLNIQIKINVENTVRKNGIS